MCKYEPSGSLQTGVIKAESRERITCVAGIIGAKKFNATAASLGLYGLMYVMQVFLYFYYLVLFQNHAI